MEKIGFLGPEGTFSNMALNTYLSKSGKQLEPCPARSIFDLFHWMAEKKCDYIVAPIENSVEGSISTTLDMLVQNKQLKISSEVVMSVSQSLIGLPGTDIRQIELVISHPQALAQCNQYLFETIPNAQTLPVPSTAQAVKMIREKCWPEDRDPMTIAAVGNRQLAEKYQLQVMADNIQDYASNSTRFVIIGTEAVEPTGYDKTSIVLSTMKDRPGGLYDLMSEFAARQINLTKIESRPTKEVLGEYLFFIDCEGHQNDPVIAGALDAIRQKASFLRVLGSFPHA